MDETRHERHIKDISKVNKHKLNPISILNYSRAKDERIIEYFRSKILNRQSRRPMRTTDRSNFFISLFTRNTGLFITGYNRFFRIFLVHRFRFEWKRERWTETAEQRERERKEIKKNRNTGKAEKWRQRKEGGKIYREPVYFHRFNARWK